MAEIDREAHRFWERWNAEWARREPLFIEAMNTIGIQPNDRDEFAISISRAIAAFVGPSRTSDLEHHDTATALKRIAAGAGEIAQGLAIIASARANLPPGQPERAEQLKRTQASIWRDISRTALPHPLRSSNAAQIEFEIEDAQSLNEPLDPWAHSFELLSKVASIHAGRPIRARSPGGAHKDNFPEFVSALANTYEEWTGKNPFALKRTGEAGMEFCAFVKSVWRIFQTKPEPGQRRIATALAALARLTP